MGKIEQQESMDRSSKITSDFTMALVVDAVLLLIASMILDGGATFHLVGSAVAAHFAGSALILLRRRKAPTKADYVFVKLAVWPLIVIAAALLPSLVSLSKL